MQMIRTGGGGVRYVTADSIKFKNKPNAQLFSKSRQGSSSGGSASAKSKAKSNSAHDQARRSSISARTRAPAATQP